MSDIHNDPPPPPTGKNKFASVLKTFGTAVRNTIDWANDHADLLVSLGVASAVGSCSVSCTQDGAQNDAIRADVRNQVLANPTPREIVIKKDGVTWSGNLVEGFAINKNDRQMGYAASQSGLTKCWFTTLQVKEGYSNLSLWKRFGPGKDEVPFSHFQNQVFNKYDCYQLPSADVK